MLTSLQKQFLKKFYINKDFNINLDVTDVNILINEHPSYSKKGIVLHKQYNNLDYTYVLGVFYNELYILEINYKHQYKINQITNNDLNVSEIVYKNMVNAVKSFIDCNLYLSMLPFTNIGDRNHE